MEEALQDREQRIEEMKWFINVKDNTLVKAVEFERLRTTEEYDDAQFAVTIDFPVDIIIPDPEVSALFDALAVNRGGFLVFFLDTYKVYDKAFFNSTFKPLVFNKKELLFISGRGV